MYSSLAGQQTKFFHIPYFSKWITKCIWLIASFVYTKQTNKERERILRCCHPQPATDERIKLERLTAGKWQREKQMKKPHSVIIQPRQEIKKTG